MFPRNGAFALRGEINDHLRFFAIEQLQQEIELMGHMAGVIDVTLAFLDIERERTGAKWVAADADDLLRIGMIQQVEGGMNAETSSATQNCISLSHHW